MSAANPNRNGHSTQCEQGGTVQDQAGRWDLVPAPLPDFINWVLWRAEPQPNRTAKIPIDPHSGHHLENWQRPDHHLSFDEAVKHHASGVGDGIGWVCTGKYGLIWLDFDGAVDDRGDTIETVHQIISGLQAPVELSLSKRGFHVPVFAPSVANEILKSGKGKISVDGSPYGFGQLEIFVRHRFVALTGNFPDPLVDRVPNRDDALQGYLKQYWPAKWPPPPSCNGTSGESQIVSAPRSLRVPQSITLTEEDYQLIARMSSAKNGQKFRRLFGDPGDLPFPDDDKRGYRSRSEADFALARILVFWTCDESGGGLDQATRIVRASQLRRSKWDEPRGDSTWLDRTLFEAYEQQKESGGFWNGKVEKRRYRRIQPRVPPIPPVSHHHLESRTLSKKTLIALGLSPAVRETYTVLRSYNRGHPYCYPSQTKLAAKLRVKERTVRNHIRILEAVGVLLTDRLQRPNGKPGRGRMYWFLKIPEDISGE